MPDASTASRTGDEQTGQITRYESRTDDALPTTWRVGIAKSAAIVSNLQMSAHEKAYIRPNDPILIIDQATNAFGRRAMWIGSFLKRKSSFYNMTVLRILSRVFSTTYHLSMIRMVFITAIVVFCQIVLPASSLANCSYVKHSELDFWVGDWIDESSTLGDLYRVSRVLDGCAVEEIVFDGRDWTTRIGTALFAYDRTTEIWRGFRIDVFGDVTEYVGRGQNDGTFVFETPRDFMGVRSRHVYSRRSSVLVTHNIFESKNGGATWSTVPWEGRYVRLEHLIDPRNRKIR